jgi:flagellar basal-body rod protein FlgB
MSSIQLFDRTTGLLKNVLDLRVRNQQVIAGNIANADTPGYAPAKLQFEQALQRTPDGGLAAGGSHPSHIPLGGSGSGPVEGNIIHTPDRSGIGDGNGVKVDQEMIALAENQILYEATTQMLNKKLGLLKYVIQDGR